MANYIVKDGVVCIKLDDGRYWCPSLQARGTRYNISNLDLKRKKNNDYITNNFVAIDFETATSKERFPCQIGITVVRNGVVDESFTRLIQPHNNEYSKGCIMVHHIMPQHTANEPLFPEVWENIKQYFEGEFLVAHNASFDINVLCRVLDFYSIERPNILGYACTCDIFNRQSLDVCCKKYGINLKHHHAGSDAEACAKLYLCHINNTPELISAEPPVQQSLFHSNSLQHETYDKNNPFFNRLVTIIGFSSSESNELKKRIELMGAEIKPSISKHIHYALIGGNVSSVKIKQLENLQHNGWDIRRLYQEDIDNIFNGDWVRYKVPYNKKKNLNLTYDHYLDHLYNSKAINPIYGKEIYVNRNNLSGDIRYFGQMCGYVGAFINEKMDPGINMCILSQSTLDSLKEGVKDDTILYIENYYNTHKAVVFDYKFISEEAVLSFIKNRISSCDDLITKEYYDKYIDSCSISFKRGNIP